MSQITGILLYLKGTFAKQALRVHVPQVHRSIGSTEKTIGRWSEH